MRLPEPRGPLSEALCRDLATSTALSATAVDPAQLADGSVALTDDDLQLSLAVCYELHYRGFDGVSEDWEWDPALIGLRSGLERRHLAALRSSPRTTARRCRRSCPRRARSSSGVNT